MASAIREFFKKKKADTKFKLAGPGHKLVDESAGKSSKSTPSVKDKAPVKPSQPSAAGARAGEAALRRIEQSQQQQKRPGGPTLENILQEERKRITEMYKQKEEQQSLEKEQTKQEERYKEFEEKQLFTCPALGLDDPCLFNDLLEKIQEKIVENYQDDLTLMSALVIKNCNRGNNNEKQIQVEQCLGVIDKILTNLLTTDLDELEKFKRLRKAKIQQKISNVEGAYEFLLSIGFEEDPEQEWLIYKDTGDQESRQEQISYYKDVLTNAEQFPIILDRQISIFRQEDLSKTDFLVDNDFYNLTISDIKRQQQELTLKREQEETLRTKAMREQDIVKNKYQTKFTRLRIKKPDGFLIEATFRTSETLEDVKTWLLMHYVELNDFEMVYGLDRFKSEDYKKTLSQLNLVPAAAIQVRI